MTTVMYVRGCKYCGEGGDLTTICERCRKFGYGRGNDVRISSYSKTKVKKKDNATPQYK